MSNFMYNTKKKMRDNFNTWYLLERKRHKKYTKLVREMSDKDYCLYKFKENTGRELNIDNPQTFMEKLNWMKLNYHNDRMPRCSDKVTAKEYVAEQGFPELIIPNYGVYTNAKDIDPCTLPDKFIMKASHGSNWNIIVTDKKNFKWHSAKRLMNMWLKESLYNFCREWNYKTDTPYIIIEELLDNEAPNDYKAMCFNGKVKAFQVNHNEGGVHYVDFYDRDWSLMEDMRYVGFNISHKPIPKPKEFDRIIEIAEKLAKPFPFVRVDFYNFDEKLYFGELTFYPGGAFLNIQPHSYDELFGSWLTLPEKNYEGND